MDRLSWFAWRWRGLAAIITAGLIAGLITLSVAGGPPLPTACHHLRAVPGKPYLTCNGRIAIP